MEIIHHRRNSINMLKSTLSKYGIEVDIRSNNTDLIINHDPFIKSIKFEEWLEYYKHNFLIVNLKEEGLEEKTLEYLKKAEITKFFFLDQSFPSLIRISSLGQKNCAIRISEYESIETALKLKDKINWVWVDTFTKLSLTVKEYKELKAANFKLCLVSPEINSLNSIEINKIKNIIKERKFKFDAVCTKFPEGWDEFYKNQ